MSIHIFILPTAWCVFMYSFRGCRCFTISAEKHLKYVYNKVRTNVRVYVLDVLLTRTDTPQHSFLQYIS